MNCNIDLHNEILESGELTCPFCNESLDKPKINHNYLCCESENVINDNGKIVCTNCGILQGYEYLKEYIDFHKNYPKLKRKSVYHRKYHINNKLMDIKQKHNIVLSYQNQLKIEKIFSDIGKITEQINNGRKRLISINYILKQILKNMDLPFENIPISI